MIKSKVLMITVLMYFVFSLKCLKCTIQEKNVDYCLFKIVLHYIKVITYASNYFYVMLTIGYL